MFKLIKIQLEIFASLQTLFPSLKIDIFCRIAPLSFIKKVIKIQLENFATLENFWTPANAVSSFENWHFLSHRPPIFHRKTHQNWAWNFWALQTLFPSLKIDIFCCIVPPISEYKMRAPEKIVPPADAVFFFENRHFLTHRPPANPPLRFDHFARAAGKFFNV